MRFVLFLPILALLGFPPPQAAAIHEQDEHPAQSEKIDIQIAYLTAQFARAKVAGPAQPAQFVRSYSDWNRAYTYDQALAALAFVRADQRNAARRVLNGLSDLQAKNGSWNFWYRIAGRGIANAPDAEPIAGAIAWVAMAANAYRIKYDDHAYDRMASAALDYLDSQRATVAYRGKVSHPVRFSPDRAGTVAVEHNLDAYSAFANAADTKHQLIAADLMTFLDSMWDETHFPAGYDLDAAKPNRAELYLDTQSWGMLALAERRAKPSSRTESRAQLLKLSRPSRSRASSISRRCARPPPMRAFRSGPRTVSERWR